MSNVKQAPRKVKTTKTGAKLGRPSRSDKLERMVNGLTDEYQHLRSLCERMYDVCQKTKKMHEKESSDWKKAANDWQGLYYTLKDALYEDGSTPEDYTQRSELAIRFSSKYRMN